MPSPAQLARRHGGDVTLLVAAAIAAATSWTTIYTRFNVTVIVVGCALLGAATALRLALEAPTRWAVGAALLLGLLGAIGFGVVTGRLLRHGCPQTAAPTHVAYPTEDCRQRV
jgi:uncharacterized membrane protein